MQDDTRVCEICEEPLDHVNSGINDTICKNCIQDHVPHITITFNKPYGHWDGKRIGGHFTIDNISGLYGSVYEHPGPGNTIRWGSWALNFYFTAKSGRSWKEAASIAAGRLSTLTRGMTSGKITVNYGRPESFVNYFVQGAKE